MFDYNTDIWSSKNISIEDFIPKDACTKFILYQQSPCQNNFLAGKNSSTQIFKKKIEHEISFTPPSIPAAWYQYMHDARIVQINTVADARAA